MKTLLAVLFLPQCWLLFPFLAGSGDRHHRLVFSPVVLSSEPTSPAPLLLVHFKVFSFSSVSLKELIINQFKLKKCFRELQGMVFVYSGWKNNYVFREVIFIRIFVICVHLANGVVFKEVI